jgi:hypothetical protein
MRYKIILLSLSLLGYCCIAYGLPRAEFISFFGLYSLLFVVYIWVISSKQIFSNRDLSFCLLAAFLFRLVFVFSEPSLSDDFWRYLWDGQLQLQGISPYKYTPQEFMDLYPAANNFLSTVFLQLNSPDYYSVYPPVNQWVFYLAVFCFPNDCMGAVMVLHLMAVLLDCGCIWVALKLIKALGFEQKNILIYALNPLVIIELNGNLHTEVNLLFLLMSTVYLGYKNRLFYAACCFGLAIATKLIPLILLPLILVYLKWKKGLIFCGVACAVFVVLMWAHIGWTEVANFYQSLELYFASFEFNASFYYLLRYALLAAYWEHWDFHAYFMDIKWVESFLSADLYLYSKRFLQLCFIGVVLVQTFKLFRKNTPNQLMKALILVYAAYFVFSTTVHPWYICPLVLCSVGTHLRFAVLWSFMIVCTYSTYQTAAMQESLWLVLLEYVVVASWFCFEFFGRDNSSKYTSYRKEV